MTATISLAEAARRGNVSTTSVRRWITSGKLNASKTAADEWVIAPDDLHLFLIRQSGGQVPPTPGRTSGRGRHGATTVLPTEPLTVGGGPDGYHEALKEAREALARERRINDELRGRVRELEQERTQHMAEMRALLSKDVKDKDGILSRWIRR